VLHPHCLGPILFASCELQTQTLENFISSRIVLFIKHQNSISQMARDPFSLQRERRLKFDLGDHLSEERVESDPVHQDSSIETYVSLQNQTPVKKLLRSCVL
jgi:hypothetical protein